MDRYDVAVIGAGFGGLAAALTAAEAGAKVALLEQLRYPGGCASTFTRRGARFESGATLFSGFGEGQLFAEWIERLRLPVTFQPLDPVIELRAPGFTLPIPPDRAAFVERVAALPDVPAERARAFFAEQRRVADALWSLFDDPSLLPPLSARAFARHLARAPRYLPLLRHVGRPLERMLRRHGLEGCAPLRTYLDAVCQITVQAGTREVEAPFALGAMDYCFRGTGHVHGGIGELAWALAHAAEARGAALRTSDRVKALTRTPEGWRVDARKGSLLADRVVANLTPHALRRVLGAEVGAHPRLDALAERVERGWGAAMLYLVLEPGAQLRPEAHHLELVVDPGAPFVEGNHLFASISGADEDRSESGGRTVTVSTHVPMERLRAAEDPGAYVARIQQRMREGLATRAPELAAAVREEMTASPRTFERFTGRDFGYVGGIPRRAGLGCYAGLWPRALLPDLWMVGDSVFPGQSTLATALGGVRTTHAMLPTHTPALLPAPAAG
ncbi:MAG TPA: FAD-dependent oxidoreductase [Polyangiaceae bacterium LLY-WYZ-15_(1-7)]|nr:FAD-dependent oxidoreductase [Sandaracinus sp.]HJL06578.1 FAD-dependent oxidoreductase [Polyangiaceae bacterium LLY-WYZ-15_(1-7)]MBJ74082.1 FAD-dependent oxidoreductase [Sandaracinus sp.]HJL13792.1 FAD-dependent oxidoreductase [Polyangiaceae bacterium LLY-WYZ-15_(1-7)]HJL29395.1 FAD-dependent oxidoreductase [Polyangiaceae bacterium LLY-WYZ-15_(1-7)]